MARGVDVRVVCFDLGGVLVRVGRTWREVLDYAGLRASADGLLDGPLDACPAFAPYQRGVLPESEYLVALRRFLGLASDAEARHAHARILMDPFPGVLEVIHALHAHGIATGCLSNTNAIHWEVLRSPERNPAIALLQTAVASHLVLEEKPQPGAFRAFEAACGQVPESIAFFDDHQANVEGARAAGWRAHAIDPHGDTAAQLRRLLASEGVSI